MFSTSLIGCATINIPKNNASIPSKSDMVETSLSYDAALNYLAKNGYVIDKTNEEAGQIITEYGPMKNSTANTNVRFEGFRTDDGTMNFRSKFKSQALGENYGCKCGMNGSIISAPFYEMVHAFDGVTVGYSKM